ncbi:MAG: glucose-1-phosphate cytidylyltransferase [Pirellulales bacterium]
MQAVILCGGQGTRIRDVAEDIPKPMIPVGGKPILWHVMKIYAAHGIKDFVLCLGYKSWTIKRFFLDYHLAGSDFTLDLSDGGAVDIHSGGCEDWRITMAETGDDAMTGCRVNRIEKYLHGERFMLTYADGVADVDISRLLKFHTAHGKLGTVTAVQPPGRFGELEIDDDKSVNEFAEKPSFSKGFISGGFFVFERRFLTRLANDPSLILEQAPLMRLARDGQLAAFQHDGFWHPMDSSRDHKYLNDLWTHNQAPWKTWDARPLRVAA